MATLLEGGGARGDLGSPHIRYVLCFDTETTGLFPSKKELQTIENMPHVIQLCFIIYDMEKKKPVTKYNKYINIPQDVEISPFITNLTGITRDKCDKGIRMIDAMRRFYKAYRICDVVVAHNLCFDKRMMEIEIQRYALDFFPDMMDACFMFNDTFNELHHITTMCTGNMGRDVCNMMIPSKFPGGRSYKKMPKLTELYEFLFHEPLEGAHDALADTEACLRCFIEMRIIRPIPDQPLVST
jgi:DNA polymerase III epsilon subunit-like protein